MKMHQLVSKARRFASFLKRKRVFLIIAGFVSLIWFLLRVIPKPQRASYPCQRAAFPLASAFVIWVVGFFASRKLYLKAFQKGFSLKASLLIVSAAVILIISLFFGHISNSVVWAITQYNTNDFGNELYAKEQAALNDDIVNATSVVGISRSKKEQATEIEFAEVDSLIRAAVKLAGGFDTLIHEGDTVVIKPNVIASHDQANGSFKNFPDSANGIATDYRVIQVVVNMVREKNASGKIYMIEGSGYGYTRPNMKAIGYDKITGIDSIVYLDEQPGTWYDKNSPEIVKVKLPTGKNLYSTTNEYFLHKVYSRAQVLISLPCLKTHFLTGVTGGVKNVGIGATPVKIYGNGPTVAKDDQPGRWEHINHGDFSTTTLPLDKWIHDFYMCRKVDYVIMDGLQGAQYGPYPGSSGDNKVLKDVQMNMRVILAGKDPIAVDAIEALSIGVDPYKVGHLLYLANDSVGCINPALIKVKGVQVADFKKLFGEHAPGNKCLYKDLTGPAARLTKLSFANNEIEVNLDSVSDIIKVELTYEDSVFEPIVVKNFSQIHFPVFSGNIDVNKVHVLVYDKYLNYHNLSLEHPVTVGQMENSAFKVFPNPATNYLKLQHMNQFSNASTYGIFSLDGKEIQSGKLIPEIPVEKLKKGAYIIKILDKQTHFCSSFVKK